MSTNLPAIPTAEDFRALARSSPWRFRTLHWTNYGAAADSRAEAAQASGVSSAPSTADPLPRPTFRPDGLVAIRPHDYHLTHGDPMWQTYLWTAMLVPEELSHDVDLTDVYAADRYGRLTWWATASATPDYDPRCSCCALIYDQVSNEIHAVDEDLQRPMP